MLNHFLKDQSNIILTKKFLEEKQQAFDSSI